MTQDQLKPGIVVYDTNTNGYRQIKKVDDEVVLVSSPCNFHDDAKTDLLRKWVPMYYALRHFTPVGEKGESEYGELFDLSWNYNGSLMVWRTKIDADRSKDFLGDRYEYASQENIAVEKAYITE